MDYMKLLPTVCMVEGVLVGIKCMVKCQALFLTLSSMPIAMSPNFLYECRPRRDDVALRHDNRPDEPFPRLPRRRR